MLFGYNVLLVYNVANTFIYYNDCMMKNYTVHNNKSKIYLGLRVTKFGKDLVFNTVTVLDVLWLSPIVMVA